MVYEQILYEVTDRIALVTLNRPDRLNAWTPQMEGEVRQAMREASNDDEVRVIVVTGAGRGFCAGADMDNLDGISSGTRREEPKRSRLMPLSCRIFKPSTRTFQLFQNQS